MHYIHTSSFYRYETFNINLISKPQWFLDMNPIGKVPTIQIGHDIYYESLPVCDYLDEAYPGRKLLPTKPEDKVKDQMALTHYHIVMTSNIRFFKKSL